MLQNGLSQVKVHGVYSRQGIGQRESTIRHEAPALPAGLKAALLTFLWVPSRTPSRGCPSTWQSFGAHNCPILCSGGQFLAAQRARH